MSNGTEQNFLRASLRANAAFSVLSGALFLAASAPLAEAIGLDEAIRWAELVVTGEGRLDVQTGFGKAVAYVAERCAAIERRCVAVAGTVEGLPTHVADAEAAAPPGVEEREAMERASELVAEAAERLLPRALGDTLRRAAGDTVGPVSSSGD